MPFIHGRVLEEMDDLADKIRKMFHRGEPVGTRDAAEKLTAIDARTDRIERGLKALQSTVDSILKETKMARAEFDAAMTDLRARVQRVTDVEQSAVTLLQGISTQLQDAIRQGDIDVVKAVADSLDAKTTELASAVAAGTPAAPPAVPPAPPA